MSTITQSSSVRLKFHCNSGNSILIPTASGLSDVLSLSTHKDIEQPTGGWSLELVPRTDYLSLLRVNDWVEIFLDNGRDVLSDEPDMIGIVDNIQETKSVDARGAPRVVINVTGRDYGKVLLSVTLVNDPVVASFLKQAELVGVEMKTQTSNQFPFNSPDQVVTNFISTFHDQRGQFLPPDSSGIPKTLDVSNVTPDLDGRIVVNFFPNVSGNLWTTMSQYAHLLLNELFIDTIKGKPSLVMREHPFSHEGFASLDYIKVYAEEGTVITVSKQVGDIRNWFRVYPEGGIIQNGEALSLDVGYCNPFSMRTDGLCRMDVSTNMFGKLDEVVDITEDGIVLGLLQKWSGKIAQWNWNNGELLSGSLTMRFQPKAKAGMRLDYYDDAKGDYFSFYIEGVQHNYRFPGGGSTVLTLSRGMPRQVGAPLVFTLLKPLDQLIADGTLVELRLQDELIKAASQVANEDPLNAGSGDILEGLSTGQAQA